MNEYASDCGYNDAIDGRNPRQPKNSSYMRGYKAGIIRVEEMVDEMRENRRSDRD